MQVSPPNRKKHNKKWLQCTPCTAVFIDAGSYRRWKVQQAADAGGDEAAGAVDLDEGARRSGAAPWLGPAPVEQTDPGVAQQPPPQRWQGRPPGWVWPETRPSRPPSLDRPHLKEIYSWLQLMLLESHRRVVSMLPLILIIGVGNCSCSFQSKTRTFLFV